MTGASQHYRYVAAAASVTMLLMSGCASKPLTGQSQQVASPMAEPKPAALPPPPPPPPPVAVAKPRPRPAQKRIVDKVGSKAGKTVKRSIRTGSLSGLFKGGPKIPRYPVWPPETPSSRVSLDRFIKGRANLSLHDAGQKLKAAFEDAGYLEYSYFSAPGGFVLVTRIEKISAKGDPLPGTERYTLPSQRNSDSLTSFVRGLFLDAPPGFYRYIAVVVSDTPYQTSRRSLSSTEAQRRLSAGSNNLSTAYKKIAFTGDHNVEALIYEFTKNSRTGKVRMIAPGRLTPRIHLAKTKLNMTIAANFKR